MSQTSSIQLNRESTTAIYNKRAKAGYVERKHIGDPIKLIVKGNGTLMDVTTKAGEPVASRAGSGDTVLQKVIYNVEAISGIAMENPRNKQFFLDGIKAEEAGDFKAAHENYNKFLNAVQMSFNVLLPAKHEFHDEEVVAAVIDLVTTDKGELLTLKNVRPIEIKTVGRSAKVDLLSMFTAKTVTDDEAAALFADANKAKA